MQPPATVTTVIENVRGGTCGRLACELLAFLVSVTAVGLQPATDMQPVAVHIRSTDALSPFDTDNLPEDDPPVTRRVADPFAPIVTTGSNAVLTQPRW